MPSVSCHETSCVPDNMRGISPAPPRATTGGRRSCSAQVFSWPAPSLASIHLRKVESCPKPEAPPGKLACTTDWLVSCQWYFLQHLQCWLWRRAACCWSWSLTPQAEMPVPCGGCPAPVCHCSGAVPSPCVAHCPLAMQTQSGCWTWEQTRRSGNLWYLWYMKTISCLCGLPVQPEVTGEETLCECWAGSQETLCNAQGRSKQP